VTFDVLTVRPQNRWAFEFRDLLVLELGTGMERIRVMDDTQLVAVGIVAFLGPGPRVTRAN